MTIQELAEYGKLRAAIAALEARNEEILSAATSSVQKMTGMPSAKGTTSDIVGNSASKMADIEGMIARKKWEMEKKRDSIAEYISTVSDPIVFAAMTCHYLDGDTWNQAAQKLGGNTGDSLRMEVKRYVRKNP